MGSARRSGALVTLALTGALWGCTARVLDGLDEAQANDLVMLLAEAGIPGTKVGRMGRFAVDVDEGDFAAAWQLARARGMPYDTHRQAGGFLSSRAEREARARQATASALGGALRADPAVAHARVVLGGRGAAVTLRAADPAAVDVAAVEAQIRAVAELASEAPVAIAVHGLPTVRLPPRAPKRRTSLWLATAAVVLMGGVCAVGWRRLRDVLGPGLRGPSIGGRPGPRR